MTLYLVDGSGIMHRAFHSYPNIIGAGGIPVGCIFGFSEILWNLLDKFRKDATHIGVIFDHPGSNFRHKLYPEYKANRKAKEPDLIAQYEGVIEASIAFNLPCIEQEGWEADDILATYATQAAKDGIKVVIISQDKDFMQLIRTNGSITMYDPMYSKEIGHREVFDKFGVLPEQVVDVQALMGDATDNVPGVPSIGIKTAGGLISKFGNLEYVLSRAVDIEKPKTRQALLDNKELALLSKKLVTLDRNVPVEVPIEELAVRPDDPGKLYEFLTKMDFQLLLSRMEKEAFS